MDVTTLLTEMLPAPDGESPVRHRTGTVVTVNANGTADLDLGGVTVDDVAVLRGTALGVGDIVQVAVWAGDLLVLGKAAGTDEAVFGSGLTVKARTNTVAGTGISVTESVEQSVTLPVPSDWTTYDIEALAVMDILESGTITAVRSVTTRLRLTDATGTLFGTNISQIGTVPPNRYQQPTFAYLTGQTATGNVVVVWTAQLGGDSGQASWDNGVFIATAYRTS
jgi:hypothetical protein